jgi:hypothetical protein
VSHLNLRRSFAYSNFKSTAGQNNHFLITILVGLDAIKSGSVEKNPDFSTTWAPRDVARSAARSRAYAINTSLVWISDLVDAYQRAAQRLPGVCTEADLKTIQGTGDDGQSRRLGRYCRHLGLEVLPELSLVQLGIHWRNRVAHSNARGLVDGHVRGALRSGDEDIRNRYNGLNVEDLIRHEATGRPPTFKEVASIMHASHQLVQAMDAAMVSRVDLHKLAEDTLAGQICVGPKSDWNTRTLSLWAGAPEKTYAKLEHMLTIAGFQKSSIDSDVGALSNEYLTSLSGLSVRDARLLFPLEQVEALPLD